MIRLDVPQGAVALLCLQRTQYRKTLSRLYTGEMIALFASLRPVLPEAPPKRTLDVGAGLAGIDALISAHYGHRPEIHLLDKDGVSPKPKPKVGWNQSVSDFGHYTSFQAARQILTKAGVPDQHLRTHDGVFPARTQFGLITSFLSWGFHYPVGTYLDEAFAALAPGGVLVLDLRKETAGMQELEQRFGHPGLVLAEGEKHARVAFTKVAPTLKGAER